MVYKRGLIKTSFMQSGQHNSPVLTVFNFNGHWLKIFEQKLQNRLFYGKRFDEDESQTVK